MRQDQSSCSLTVDGRDIPIVFAKRGGGLVDSEESKYPPGGGLPEKALGGRQTVENVTLTGEYEPAIHQSIVAFLESRAGKGDATVVEQSLDADGNAFGSPETWTGKVKSVSRGEYDAGATDARELEIEISTHGVKT